MLTTFGISSRMYQVHGGGDVACCRAATARRPPTRRRPSYDLRITSGSIERFAAEIGFGLSAKADRLAEIVSSRVRGPYAVETSARLIERSDEGIELTYNLSEPRNHSYVADGIVVRNCSEYMHLDNSACNLASLNLLAFLHDDGEFDVEGYKAAVEVVFTAQEILVGNADYPTEKIADTSRKFRQLGLGYANLGALLMALGMPYDSDSGTGVGGGAHRTHDRPRVRNVRAYGRADGAVLGLRREQRAHAPRAADAPGRGREGRRGARASDVVGGSTAVMGRSGRARRAVRRAQLAGDGARAHGHDLVPDGLRHHGHRARPRAREDEEVGRRRHDVDRQPDRSAGARSPRILTVPDRQHRGVHRRQHVDRRRAASEGRAPSRVRVLDGRQRHPLHGPRADDGGRAALHQRGDLQDDQHA